MSDRAAHTRADFRASPPTLTTQKEFPAMRICDDTHTQTDGRTDGQTVVKKSIRIVTRRR